MKLAVLLACATPASSVDMSWLYGEQAPPTPQSPPSGGGYDMSATFAKLRTCDVCIGAGYGWCPVRRKCGGFANKVCGQGEAYVAEGHSPRDSSSQKPRRRSSSREAPPRASPQQGTDMRAVFAKLRTCDACIGAGYGWCPMQRKCGGFANRNCGVGLNYVSSEPEPSTGADRNGLWRSKRAQETAPPVDDQMVFDVPAASPPPPTAILHAGPASTPATASPPVASPKASNGAAAVSAFVSVGAYGSTSNDSASAAELPQWDPLSRPEELQSMSREALVGRVLALQQELKAWREL